MNKNTPIYRPSFIAEEIIELHNYLTQLPEEIIQEPLLYNKIQIKIATLAFKIDKGIAKAAYIKEDKPKQSLFDSLGGTELIDPTIKKDLYKEDSLDDWHEQEKQFREDNTKS